MANKASSMASLARSGCDSFRCQAKNFPIASGPTMEQDEEQDHGHVNKEDLARKKSAGSKDKIKKKRSREDAEREGKHGICYLSRVPPRMDPSHVRQIFSQYGDIQRIYLAPEDDAVQVKRKQSGGFRGKGFSEGWVEFTKKSVAKEVTRMLNGEQIGGKRRSAFFYDIWNIKYLSKFKWDDLIGELAIKKHEREEKLKLAISAAKRERDFYLSKLEQSKVLKSIKEKKDKKQKVEGQDKDGGAFENKVFRQFPQKRPVSDDVQNKPALSRELLAGVFAHSSP